ncbi:MAG: alkaline phosphatase [Clostridiaceae bacterium]|nr:alkaline phosphatase [Clostridiaceae bacterium]
MRKLSKVFCFIIALTLLFVNLSAGIQVIAAEPEQAPPQAVIFPVNRASILAGSIFDLKVELNNIPSAPTEFNVKVQGKDADTFFNKAASTGATTQNGQYKLWKDVAIKSPVGSYTVSVNAKGAGWTLSKEVKYNVVKAEAGKAKNVILIIGDGLALPMRTAARMVSKNLTEGKYNGLLEMDNMDQVTLVTTSGLNSLVTDSANSASAYATGHKTSNNAMGVYTFDPNDDKQVAPKVENIVELAKKAGKSTGLVTTSEITDATPAAMFVHIPKRSNMQQIVDQMYNPSQRPDVIMGGGASWFWPKSVTGSKRTDERDLIGDFEKEGYQFVGNAKELKNVDTAKTNKLLGLFHNSTMNVYIDKAIEKNSDVLKNYPDQPVLWDMTEKALNILSKNEKGFFLMVEGASIDKQEHAMEWERAVWDTIEMDKAVGAAKRFADKNKDTLVIVVADHSHSVSVYGTVDYSKSGRDAVRVYEKAQWPTYKDNDGDGFPDTGKDGNGDGKFDQVVATDIALAIGWGNHPDYVEDFKYSSKPGSPAVTIDGEAVANFEGSKNGGVFIAGNLPLSDNQEVHSADDVPLTAYGAGSEYFDKAIIDNTDVFFGIINALGLDPTAFK